MVDKLEIRLCLVKWQSRYNDGRGELGPLEEKLANAIVRRCRELFPDIEYRIEIVQAASA